MIKIYHNNRCSKSRCGLEILEQSGKPFEVVKVNSSAELTDESVNKITVNEVNNSFISVPFIYICVKTI